MSTKIFVILTKIFVSRVPAAPAGREALEMSCRPGPGTGPGRRARVRFGMADPKARWPFVSVVALPEGLDREQAARLLAAPGGLDLPTLRLRLGRETPMALERVEPPAGAAMVRDLVAAGGDGFTFTLDDLASIGPNFLVKDLAVGEGALSVELRQGITTTIPFAAVQIIVRAHLHETVIHRGPTPRISLVFGRKRTWDSIKAEIESSVTREVETSDKLDIHAADGSVYRVDGDRFGFRVLGALRGHSDKANMDSLLELLGHLCPDAVVDTYFRLWRPPPGSQFLRVPHERRSAAPFDFYSRWAALTYRHLMS